ncbi:metal ABC transporter solute-binding protein, Zn/Mn family [Arthrobacter sp. CAN_A6]|uniref:metal ABC transporter solute-binding protein, Zn/Mn family n=1 Tax=Arthrobacter sp. CAN_A6 TaxID=2787721 RepID=UPI0018CA0741
MHRGSTRRPTQFLTGIALVALSVSACGTGSGTASDAPSGSSDGKLQVVTSTNVYGSIAEAIGGDDVEVTAIVTSLSQDPHSYEATVQDKLAVSKADLVVENGGGYDPFLHRLADETEIDHDAIVSAVDVSGLEGAPDEHAGEEDAEGEHAEEEHAEEEHAEEEGHAHGSFNEHVWYDLPAMSSLADTIAGKLAGLDEANAGDYEERAAAFKEGLGGVEDSLADIRATGGGGDMAVTEPVPVYLLEAAGFVNVTPSGYSEAIEEETDVPVAVLDEMQTLVASGSVRFLAYNNQTEGPQTQSVKAAADEAGVPVVNFTETLPDGEDFLSWMTANTANVAAVVGT